MMPRQGRLDAPGILYYIMILGIESRNIFKNDKDRDDMIERLATVLPEPQTARYAWGFIQNHYYFLFRSVVSPHCH